VVLHVLERAARIGPPVILATTSDSQDDELAAMVAAAGYRVFRGSQEDVLDRFVQALSPDARYVVRVTADCPLFDPAVGRALLATVLEGGIDYATNTLPPSFPDGLDCWVLTTDLLRLAWREATLASDREHVLPWIWRNPERFRVWNLTHAPDLSAERWTVDDDRDLAFVRAVYELIAPLPVGERHSMYAVLGALARNPELREINAGTLRDEGYARSVSADRELPRRSDG